MLRFKDRSHSIPEGKEGGKRKIKQVLYACEENKCNDIPYKVTQIQKQLKVLCS